MRLLGEGPGREGSKADGPGFRLAGAPEQGRARQPPKQELAHHSPQRPLCPSQQHRRQPSRPCLKLETATSSMPKTREPRLSTDGLLSLGQSGCTQEAGPCQDEDRRPLSETRVDPLAPPWVARGSGCWALCQCDLPLSEVRVGPLGHFLSAQGLWGLGSFSVWSATLGSQASREALSLLPPGREAVSTTCWHRSYLWQWSCQPLESTAWDETLSLQPPPADHRGEPEKAKLGSCPSAHCGVPPLAEGGSEWVNCSNRPRDLPAVSLTWPLSHILHPIPRGTDKVQPPHTTTCCAHSCPLHAHAST